MCSGAEVLLKLAESDKDAKDWEGETQRYELALEVYENSEEAYMSSDVFRAYIAFRGASAASDEKCEARAFRGAKRREMRVR